MRVVTAAEMRAIDRRADAEFGLTETALMEQAAQCVVAAAEERFGPLVGRRVVVVCGKGNNGGDGLVAVRLLQAAGVAARAWQIAQSSELSTLAADLAAADLIIDALLGTGIRGAVTGRTADVIELINAAGRPVLAVDLPSGIAADTGQICGVAVTADVTVTLGLPKPGLLLHPGAARAGVRLVGDIGLPSALTDAAPGTSGILTPADVAARLPRRAATAHKGDAGRALIVAGARGFTGAAALAATAALRGGAGLVTVLAPASVQQVLAVKLTEAMAAALPDADGQLAPAAAAELLPWLTKADAVAIGPGLGTGAGARETVLTALATAAAPLVLDADALNVIAAGPDPAGRLRAAGAPIVITPHPGEFARLTGATVAAIEADRLAAARAFATAADCCVVLKGAPTVVALPDGAAWLNPTGNPGMASGGMGDALTGLLAALIAQGLPVEVAAPVGVWLHGLAGDLAAATVGEVGIVASDLIERLPAARQRAFVAAARTPSAHHSPARLVDLAEHCRA